MGCLNIYRMVDYNDIGLCINTYIHTQECVCGACIIKLAVKVRKLNLHTGGLFIYKRLKLNNYSLLIRG